MRILIGATIAAAIIGTAGFAQERQVDPATFAGASGWAVIVGTTRVTASEVALGMSLAEQHVRYVRTGVFSEAIISGGSLAKQTVSSGLPAYAVEMDGYGVGWCTPGGDARDLGARLASSNKERCVFNDPKNGPFRTQGYDGKSQFAASLMTGMYKVRSTIRIKEQPVEFGRTFALKVTVVKFDPKQLRIDYWFDDGTNRTRLVAQKLKPSPDGWFHLPLWQGKVRLRPDGAKIRVETLEPLKDSLSEHPELRGVRFFSPTINIISI